MLLLDLEGLKLSFEFGDARRIEKTLELFLPKESDRLLLAKLHLAPLILCFFDFEEELKKHLS